MASRQAPFKIGMVIGSQRPLRAGPQITSFVQETIQSHLDAQAAAAAASASTLAPAPASFSFDLIDVRALGLPLLDEPDMPHSVTSRPSGYAHAHTRAWSARVAALHGLFFVSPQYNWGVPAGLKNALDYLYHEWVGKPAAVVTYGGHGGTQCAEQLRAVLGGGLKMRLAGDKAVCMAFPSGAFTARAAAGQPLALDPADDDGPFAAYRQDIVALWDAMVQMLGSPSGAA